MRKHVFRGKDEQGRTWTGDLWQFRGKTYIGLHAVIPETVAEFTGCRDAAGADLYEGDAVTVDGEPAFITFTPGAFWLNYSPDSGKTPEMLGFATATGRVMKRGAGDGGRRMG